MPLHLVTITEGRTRLLVPRESLSKREPDTTPVFFNPAARVNRDISVAMTTVVRGRSFCDALAGTGPRGIRIAKEVHRSNLSVTLNDFNKASLAIAKRNARLNRVTERCNFSHDEANHFLYSRFGRDEKFDFIDVDPFGTPAPFLMGALAASSRESVISVTATDAAVLCGVYPKVAFRRYGSSSRRSDFEHETAIRILLAFCSRLAALGDIGIEPIACHSTRHYLRVYSRTLRSASAADRALKSLGFVTNCVACGENTVSESRPQTCPKCGAKAHPAGPLWTGPLADDEIAKEAARVADRKKFTEAAAILRALVGVDRYPPFGYDLESICSRLKISSVPQARVLELLSQQGYTSMRQPFEKNGLKTKAAHSEVVEVVKRASSSSLLSPSSHADQVEL